MHAIVNSLFGIFRILTFNESIKKEYVYSYRKRYAESIYKNCFLRILLSAIFPSVGSFFDFCNLKKKKMKITIYLHVPLVWFTA